MTEPTSTHSGSASTGELVSQLSSEVSTLIRDELQLAQAEMTQKTKKAGMGAGLFGGARVVGLYGIRGTSDRGHSRPCCPPGPVARRPNRRSGIVSHSGTACVARQAQRLRRRAAGARAGNH